MIVIYQPRPGSPLCLLAVQCSQNSDSSKSRSGDRCTLHLIRASCRNLSPFLIVSCSAFMLLCSAVCCCSRCSLRSCYLLLPPHEVLQSHRLHSTHLWAPLLWFPSRSCYFIASHIYWQIIHYNIFMPTGNEYIEATPCLTYLCKNILMLNESIEFNII